MVIPLVILLALLLTLTLFCYWGYMELRDGFRTPLIVFGVTSLTLVPFAAGTPMSPELALGLIGSAVFWAYGLVRLSEEPSSQFLGLASIVPFMVCFAAVLGRH